MVTTSQLVRRSSLISTLYRRALIAFFASAAIRREFSTGSQDVRVSSSSNFHHLQRNHMQPLADLPPPPAVVFYLPLTVFFLTRTNWPLPSCTADTVLSTMSRSPDRSSIPATIRTIFDDFGLGGLFLGLPSRIVWSGAIISGQFLLYDICKTALHVSADDLRVFLDVIASSGL